MQLRAPGAGVGVEEDPASGNCELDGLRVALEGRWSGDLGEGNLLQCKFKFYLADFGGRVEESDLGLFTWIQSLSQGNNVGKIRLSVVLGSSPVWSSIHMSHIACEAFLMLLSSTYKWSNLEQNLAVSSILAIDC
eukprot:SAG31_NODE_1102_length_9897_cov_16.273015_11_plen_135_part_00